MHGVFSEKTYSAGRSMSNRPNRGKLMASESPFSATRFVPRLSEGNLDSEATRCDDVVTERFAKSFDQAHEWVQVFNLHKHSPGLDFPKAENLWPLARLQVAQCCAALLTCFAKPVWVARSTSGFGQNVASR